MIEKGMTQAELADVIAIYYPEKPIKREHLTNIINGKKSPNWTTVKMLCNVLDCKPNDILE